MKVGDLVGALGTKFNIPRDKLENLDLDNLVKQSLNNERIVPDGEDAEETVLLMPMEEHFADIWLVLFGNLQSKLQIDYREEIGRIDDSPSASLASASLPPPDPIMHDER
jgi:hypothetical protein